MMRLYTYVIIPDVESNTFTGIVQECPGCLSEGDTPVETLQNLQEALEDWLDAAKDLGQDIPATADTRMVIKQLNYIKTRESIPDV